MHPSYSNAEPYLAQLKSIEQQIQQHQLQKAALQLNQLVKTNTHDPRLFLLGSRLAEAAGNPDGVLVAARKAHELEPAWPVSSIHLAGVLASRGEAAEAMSLAGQALQQSEAQGIQATDRIELLSKAVNVAQRFGRHALALQWLRQAQQISPDDQDIRYKIGLTLTQGGDPASAIAIFTDLLMQRPNNPALLSARMQACLAAQQSAQAIRDGETLLAMEPTNEEYRFYLDVARGLTPKTLPVALILGLVDADAARLADPTNVQLQHKLPRDVAQMISQWHPDRKGDVLDLGCGTGLLGAYLGPIEGVLVGVELSGDRIEQAARHHVYDSFHQVNLLGALQATPENLYHVITALDVFSYIGSLDAVIPNAYRILLPGGRFVFSCESGTGGAADYALQDNSYRYGHQLSYVQRLLQAAGFEEIATEGCVLRHEAAQPIQGFLVSARKAPPKVRKSASRPKKGGKPS
jgi:predicted TPR repeat methyltransferase